MPPKKQQKPRKINNGVEETQEDSRVSSGVAFQTQRRKLYDEARNSIQDLVTTSIQFLEQARAQILEMKLQEVESDSLLKDYNQLHSNKDHAYTQWHGRSQAFVRKLGEERSVVVDDASKMLNKAATERKLALQGFLKDARSQVEQSREQEKLATDASELIKHYKNLLGVGRVNEQRQG